MLNSLIRLSLRYRLLVVCLSLVALVGGSYLTTHLTIDVFPDLDRPRVVIITEAPGLAAQDMETLVTYEVEAALLGASGVQGVRSLSAGGVSMIYVEFDWGTDIYLARQTVQERLNAVQGRLPPGLQPQMGPIGSIMGQIMQLGVHVRPGPGGGQLAIIGKTGIVAELLLDEASAQVKLCLWQPGPNRAAWQQPASWPAGSADDDSVTLRWEAESPTGPKASAPGELTLRASGPQRVCFTGQWSEAGFAGRERFGRLNRRVTLKLGQQVHEVLFPGRTQEQMELRTLADWAIRQQLLKVPGVAQVLVMGGERKQYQVLVDPQALRHHEVTLAEVEQALRRNNLDTSGGVAVQGEVERPVRILGRLGSTPAQVLRQLEQIVVKNAPFAHNSSSPGEERKKMPSRPITVAHVAQVVEGPAFKRADASIDSVPGVVITVAKQPHQDTRALTVAVHQALDQLEESLPPTMVINRNIFQMKGFIDRAIYNVLEALVIGAVLVIIVLFLFLLNFRTTFISLLAIPLSLVLTTLVFRLVGWWMRSELTLNVMTLGGIAVAMGELVDDAIVDVENIFRRLKEWNAARTAGETAAIQRSPLRVIYDASIEVRGAIVYGTAVVILVFLPLFALSGMEGRLFTPLGAAYIISILASLLVSLTVTPVLSYYLLPRARAAHHKGDGWLLRQLKGGATYLIQLSLARAGWLLLASWVLVLGAALLFLNLGRDFLPKFDEGSVQVNVALPPDASLTASNKVGALVDSRLRTMQKTTANPDGFILHFARRTGRAEGDEHPLPVSSSEYLVAIDPHCPLSRQEVMKRIEDDLRAHVPGTDLEVEQPLMHLIDHMLSGVTAQIAIRIYGEDLDVLRRLAGRIKQAIVDVPGLKPPVIEAQTQVEELHLRLRPERLTFYGLDRQTVADYVSAALGGVQISQVLEGQRRFDLIVRLHERFRGDLQAIRQLRVPLPGGEGEVPLSELAEVGIRAGPNVLNRDKGQRRLLIRCNARERDVGSVMEDIKDRIRQEVQLPPGYTIDYAGQAQSQQAAAWRILGLSILSFLGICAILYMVFPSWRIVLQILNALPTAFVGGVVALWLTGQSVTVASLVGFISLGGIATRNGILLVTHYFHLMKYEGEAFTEKMVLRGSLERLAPVLMTALTAALALLPLVLGGQQPGREILFPVATVILGGLVTSTLCEFLLHPGLFWNYSGKDAQRLTTLQPFVD